MAGVTMMPAQKVGTEFLASSHFRIAQEDSVTKGTLKSTFKCDYPPWDINSKPPGAIPPRLADVLQTDLRYFNQKASETKQAYQRHDSYKPEVADVKNKLGATNFKMDSDPRQNSFQTTHKLDYTPKSATTAPVRPTNPRRSYIPQGDPDKAPEPISDYRDRYRGHSASRSRRDKLGSHYGGPPTIQGDKREQHYNTTHNDTFKGLHLPKLDAYPAPQGSNIPQGDTDKEINMVTTHQMAFQKHKLPERSYDKDTVMAKLQGTNFKQADGHGSWNNYQSTMAESYQPIDGPIERRGPLRSRNESDFPLGDEDPWSNAQRANMTTNRFYMGNPPRTLKPKIESGADKRTKSQVVFGEPSQAREFYETTTNSTFQPVSVPYKNHSTSINTRSAVPMDYYDEHNNTTYHSDFINPEKEKMIPNPVAIEKLKGSHIHPPLGARRWFTTEHLEQYTPKEACLGPITEPGKLQRSSVPIGTLNQYA